MRRSAADDPPGRKRSRTGSLHHSPRGVTMGWLLRLEFIVINFSVRLVLPVVSNNDFCYSLVNSLILNTFSIRFVVLLASDRLARSSKFLLISASYFLF